MSGWKWTPMLLVSAGLMDVRVDLDADVVGQWSAQA